MKSKDIDKTFKTYTDKTFNGYEIGIRRIDNNQEHGRFMIVNSIDELMSLYNSIGNVLIKEHASNTGDEHLSRAMKNIDGDGWRKRFYEAGKVMNECV